MAKIKTIYEKHRHRYGYRRIIPELRRLSWPVNHKKVQRLMNKLKLFGIVSKRLRKYNSNHGTQDPIKTDLIKRNFNAICPEYKWYLDMSEFKLNNHKTYLSPIIDSYTQ